MINVRLKKFVKRMANRKYCYYLSIVISMHLLLSGCIGSGRAEDEGTYQVSQVKDGDTIRLSNGENLRYIGISCPETRKKIGGTWVPDPEEYGIAAKEYNFALVGGNRVKLEFDEEKRDKFNRLLAYVYTDNGMLANAELLREGLAHVYIFPPNLKQYDLLVSAQNEAIQKKRGFWKTIKEILPSEADKHVGKYVIIDNVVESVRYGQYGSIEIFFEGTSQKGLRIIIPAKNISFFKDKGVDPFKFRANNIRMFGQVKENGYLRILLTSPSQILEK